MSDTTVRVETYGIAEFLKLVEPLIKDGYSFDYETNENYPQSYGAFYSAIMVKKGTEQVENTEIPVKTEDISVKTEVKQVGRPKKS